MSVAGTVAVNCAALPNVVASATSFHSTVELLTKLLPFTVNVNCGPPSIAEGGTSDVSEAKGGVVVNGKALEVVPGPGVSAITFALRTVANAVGLKTATGAKPSVAMSVAGTVAVSCVALPNVVTRAVPFHSTIEELMKLLPFTVNVNSGPPATAEDGTRDVSWAVGVITAVTGKLTEVEAP